MQKTEMEQLEKEPYDVDVKIEKTENNQINIRRSPLEIIYTILKACENGEKKRFIYDKAGITNKQWKEYNLIEKRFLRELIKGRLKICFLEERGREFIDIFNNFIRMGVIAEENIKLREVHKKPPRQIPPYEIEWKKKLEELGNINYGIFVQIIKFLNGSHISRPFYSVPIDTQYKMHIRRGKESRITIYHHPFPDSYYQRIESENLPLEIVNLITNKLQEIENESFKSQYDIYKKPRPPRKVPQYEIEWKKMLQKLGNTKRNRFKRTIKSLNGYIISRPFYSVPIDTQYKIVIKRGNKPYITIHYRPSPESDYQPIESENLPLKIVNLITNKLQEIENESLKPVYRPLKKVSVKKSPKKIPKELQKMMRPYMPPKPHILDDSAYGSLKKWQGEVKRLKGNYEYEIIVRVGIDPLQLNKKALKSTVLKILGRKYKNLSLNNFIYDKSFGIAIFYVSSDRIIRYPDLFNALNDLKSDRSLLLLA